MDMIPLGEDRGRAIWKSLMCKRERMGNMLFLYEWKKNGLVGLRRIVVVVHAF
jgi:hypothetical protein